VPDQIDDAPNRVVRIAGADDVNIRLGAGPGGSAIRP
jgi:hypothetical protein